MRDGPRNRSSRGRIMRWNEDKDQLLILALDNICKKKSFGIPWNEVAALIDPRATGGAVEQHIAKLRKRRLDQGQDVPPLARLQRWSRTVPAPHNSETGNSSSSIDRRLSTRVKPKTILYRCDDEEDLSEDDDDYETDDDWEKRKQNRPKDGKRFRAVFSSLTGSSSDDSPGETDDREFLPRQAKCAQKSEKVTEPWYDDHEKVIAQKASTPDPGVWESRREEQEIAESKNEISLDKSHKPGDDSSLVQHLENRSMVVKLPINSMALESLGHNLEQRESVLNPVDAKVLHCPEPWQGKRYSNDGENCVLPFIQQDIPVFQHSGLEFFGGELSLDATISHADDSIDSSRLPTMPGPVETRSWLPFTDLYLQDTNVQSNISNYGAGQVEWLPWNSESSAQLPVYNSAYSEHQDAGKQSSITQDGNVPPSPFTLGSIPFESYEDGNEEAFKHETFQEQDSDILQFLAPAYH